MTLPWTRLLRPALLLALLTAILASALPAAAADDVRLPLARVGDEAGYAAAGTTIAWDAVAGYPTLAFAWLPVEATEDRWGLAHQAQVLRFLRPRINDASGLQWVEMRTAFAGVAWDPIWLRGGVDANLTETVYDLPTPMLGRTVTTNRSVSFQSYTPPVYVMHCAAHHGLQGHTVRAGDAVALAQLCPGLRLDPPAAAAAVAQARETTFLARPAVELRYEVPSQALPGVLEAWAAEEAAGGPQGMTLRFVLADAFAFLGVVEVTGADGTALLRMDLTGFRGGGGEAEGGGDGGGDGGREGAEVPAWRDQGLPLPAAREGMRFAPMTRDGPADGGSGLPYTLEAAVANLRGDASLARFQAWLRGHPGAFVAEATYQAWAGPEGTPWAPVGWNVTFASPGSGRLEGFHVRSTVNPLPVGPLPGAPAGVVANEELGEALVAMPAFPPQGEPALTVASALRVWQEEAPEAFQGEPPTHLRYAAPVPGRPATLSVGALREDVDGEVRYATLDVDLASGAPSLAFRSHTEVTYGIWDLDPQAADEILATYAPPPSLPLVEVLAVAAATGLVAGLVAVLSKGSGTLAVGYSRLVGSDLLKHERRLLIHDIIAKHPGISHNALMQRIDVGPATIAHHLKVLLRERFITEVRTEGNYRRYYLFSTAPLNELKARAELAAGSAQRIYDAVLAEPGITATELADRVGMTRQAVSKVVKRLVKAGLLIPTRRKGRAVHLTARELTGEGDWGASRREHGFRGGAPA